MSRPRRLTHLLWAEIFPNVLEGEAVCKAHRNPKGPFRAVCLRYVTAPDQFGPVAVRVETLDQCRDGGLEVDLVRVRGEAIDLTGGLRVQVPPAGESQVRIQTSVQIPQAVRLVGLRFVG